MRDFQLNDLVGYDSPEDGYIYGFVVDIFETELELESIDAPYDQFQVPKDKADYIEPIFLNDETVRRFARYEICFKELAGDVFPPHRLRSKGPYSLTIDDLLCVLRKASSLPCSQLNEEWLFPICNIMDRSYFCGSSDLSIAGESGCRFLPTENYVIYCAMNSLLKCLYNDNNDYSEIIEKLVFWKELFSLPFEQREYPDKAKTAYISAFDDQYMLDNASEAELALFIRFVEDLCEKNEKTALYIKAYGCYGGNRAFPCDWITSRDTFLKLSEIDDNPYLANSLGYIYYYGRCTDGEPEYEKAFRYFSIGAAAGIYESQYKLSDMFRHGYGVPKNGNIASDIIWRMYNEKIKDIYNSILNSKFADVALRLGNLKKEGIGSKKNANAAYYYYLQADFAIRMRMLEDDQYGDSKVAEGIRSSIDAILPLTKYQRPRRTVRYDDLDSLLKSSHSDTHRMEMKIRRAKDGELHLKFRVLPKGDDNYPPRLFITEPIAHFCGYCDTLSAKTVDLQKLYLGNRVFKGDSATIIFDDMWGDEFYLYGNKVAEIICDEYKVVYPAKEKLERKRFVSVKFPSERWKYDYTCDIPDIKVGDKVIVPTWPIEKVAEAIRVYYKDATETALPMAKYKAVLRKA